jgi:NADH-quinone oxidoreductase subunit C
MKNAEEIFQILKNKFLESVIELKTDQPTEPLILIKSLEIDKVCSFLRLEKDLQFDSLMNLSGVDEVKENLLSVYYHLESTSLKHKITLKATTKSENPEVSSVVEVWQGANWHEREAFDMFGIKFLNHPDLRRILMPYDWEAGYPLRKDYENPEYYLGMKVPY